MVVSEELGNCITTDKSRLPLIEVYDSWINADFLVHKNVFRSLAAEMRHRCDLAGIDPDEHQVSQLLGRLMRQPAEQPAEEAEQPAEDPREESRDRRVGAEVSTTRTRKRAKTAGPGLTPE